MPLQSLLDDFALFEDWEDRYRYIIDLGGRLAPLTPDEYRDDLKVAGCVSQAWLVSAYDGKTLTFRGDSDAHIVRGLIAILIDLFSGQTPQDILAVDAEAAFTALGLGDHLTPQRSNGFYAMIARVRNDAAAACADCNP